MLATALQLIPHYHGPFVTIAERDNRPVGVTTNEPIDVNVAKPDNYNDGAVASLVNPLAAAIVQYRVVYPL